MNTLENRINVAIRHYLSKNNFKKLDRAEMASFCDATVAAIGQWINGKVNSLDSLKNSKAAQFLGVNPYWLAGDSGYSMLDNISELKKLHADWKPNEIQTYENEDPIPDGFVAIDFYKYIHVSAGNGCINTDNCTAQKLLFPLSLVQECNVNTNTSKVLVVRGDSMYPELVDGQNISIDTSAKKIFDGEIYAFLKGDELKIKYLFSWQDEGKNGFKAVSRNKDKIRYPDEYYSPARIEAENIQIIGQYWWKSETRRIRR